MSRPAAYKLPHLLSLLPKGGRAALVRPAQWPADSFYRVTRSSLKFREADGEVRAGGKAWGQLFWKGKLVNQRGVPDPRIRGGLKYRWLAVEAEGLHASTAEALAAAETTLAETTQARAEDLAARRAAKRDRAAARREA